MVGGSRYDQIIIVLGLMRYPSLMISKIDLHESCKGPCYDDAGGSFNAEEIDSFVKLNKYPLVTVLNSKNANLVYASPLKLHV